MCFHLFSTDSHLEGVKSFVLLRGTMEMKQPAATNGIDQDQEADSRIIMVRPSILPRLPPPPPPTPPTPPTPPILPFCKATRQQHQI